MPNFRPTARLVPLALAALALQACAGGVFDASGPRAELRANRELWQRERVADYAYTIRRSCFCGQEVGGPVRVEVRGGQTVSVTPLGGQAPARGAFDRLDTVEELFDAVEEGIGREPDLFMAFYHGERGHPIKLLVDDDRRAVDEEDGFEVTDFVALP